MLICSDIRLSTLQHKAEQLARAQSYIATDEHMLVASPTGSPKASPGKGGADDDGGDVHSG